MNIDIELSHLQELSVGLTEVKIEIDSSLLVDAIATKNTDEELTLFVKDLIDMLGVQTIESSLKVYKELEDEV